MAAVTDDKYSLQIAAASGGKQSSVQFLDESSSLGAPGSITSVNFTGTGVTATNSAGALTVTVPGGSGSGIARSVTVTAANYTAGAAANTDYVYLVAGLHTGTLPTAVGNLNMYTIKNNHSANVTLGCTGAETIDGTTTISIPPQNSVDLVSDGSAWRIV